MEDLLASYSSDSTNALPVRYTSSSSNQEMYSQYFGRAAQSLAFLAQDLSEEKVISKKKDNDTQAEESSAEDTSTEESSAEDTSTEESSAEDTSTEESSAEDTSTEESSAEDTSTEENLIKKNYQR